MGVIDVRDLRKTFRIPSVKRETIREHLFGALTRRTWDELRVLDGVTFSVEKGETFGIMGRNGCGKSTLLKILSGIYRPDGGAVEVNAPVTPILELGLGWNGELTAEDNVLLTGTAMGLTIKEVRNELQRILQFAELERFANLELKHYSSGMSARLAYAIAFHAVREILILDEVLAVGDAGFRQKCVERFHELRKAGRTIVMVGHDADAMATFCDRAILLDGGKIILEGAPKTIADEYQRMLGAA